jgi:hypothetical protein
MLSAKAVAVAAAASCAAAYLQANGVPAFVQGWFVTRAAAEAQLHQLYRPVDNLLLRAVGACVCTRGQGHTPARVPTSSAACACLSPHHYNRPQAMPRWRSLGTPGFSGWSQPWRQPGSATDTSQ